MDTDFMTFISENYVVIILIAVVILMTIIGYFADKNDNVKKEKKANKKPSNDILDDVEDVMTEDNSFVDDEEVPVEESIEMPEVEPVQTEDTPLYDSFDMPTDIEPTEEVKMEAPEVSVEQSTEEPVEVTEADEVQTEEPVVEDITFNPNESQDFQLPNIEKLNEELSTVDDDEDVWKF